MMVSARYTSRRLRSAGASLLLISATRNVSSLSALSRLPFDVTNQMILAPLTRGGNLPYRRLCAFFGCQVSLSEMVYARSLLRGDRVESARLRRASNEQHFGVQIATNNVEEGRAAMAMAKEAGADFVDLNCGCPINEATRRGLGSSLLRSPKKLGRLVSGLAESYDIPLTVKIRLGCEDDTINVEEVVKTLRDGGAAAVTIHGRTAQQRYSKQCDWELIRQVVEDERADDSTDGTHHVPIIGNGDILTHYEARRRMKESGVDAVMVGRGALVKPWIFQEHRDGIEWEPDVKDRIAIYRALSIYMKEHFGDDAMGKKKSMFFLPWHFEFLSRYMPLPEDEYGPISQDSPLIQSRIVQEVNAEMPPLERLLSCRNKKVHELIAERLWESTSDVDAVTMLTSFADSSEFKEIQASSNAEDALPETEELSNIPKGRDDRRRGRNPKPKRTPEEIRIVRAERAAKKAALAEAQGQCGDNDNVLSGPLKDQKGIIKRWVTSGRAGQFGFIGIVGVKGEFICHESGLGDNVLPINDGALPISVIFDTEIADDKSKSDRAVNVRLA